MGKRILVVDDEPDMVTYLTTLLEDNGYEVITATDGEEGLEKAVAEKPDLVSLDLLMPNRTGINMFRMLRRDSNVGDTPVVMVTGLADGDIPQMDFKKWIQERSIRGPEAYLEKPLDTEAFLAAVKDLTG